MVQQLQKAPPSAPGTQKTPGCGTLMGIYCPVCREAHHLLRDELLVPFSQGKEAEEERPEVALESRHVFLIQEE